MEPLEASRAPDTATAASRPCQLYSYHQPRPSRTQGHHRRPVYLQVRIHGEAKDQELLWVCGSCHDSIHEWLSWLLKEARQPNPEPGYKAKAEAEKAFTWYQAAKAEKDAIL